MLKAISNNWPVRKGRLIAVLCFGLAANVLFSRIALAAEAQITLASEVVYHMDGGITAAESAHQFDCNQRIYGIAEVSSLEPGKHDLTIEWIGPSGELEYEQTFQFVLTDESNGSLGQLGQSGEPKPLYLSSFIEFHSQGFLASLFEPGAGLESYIGDWKVRVKNNGAAISSTEFSLMC